MAAMPSPRPVRPRPSVVVADRDTAAPDSASLSTATASARRGPILGRLPITQTATFPMTYPASPTSRAVSRSSATPGAPAHSRPRGPEVRTEIPEPGRGKQRITSRMSSGIPIRMPGKPRLPRPLKPSKKQNPSRLERMHIHPKPNPRYVLHAAAPLPRVQGNAAR